MSWRDIVRSSPLGTKSTKPTEVPMADSSVGIVGFARKGEVGQVGARAFGSVAFKSLGTKPTEVPVPDSSVGTVGSVPKGEILKTVWSEPTRWPRFTALCMSHGVTKDQLASMFTEQDVVDLCEEPDYKLPKHAATIASAAKLTYGNGPIAAPTQRIQPVLVRCGACRYFECNEQHPNTGLGSCTARLEIKMGIPARRIECIDYELRPPTPA